MSKTRTPDILRKSHRHTDRKERAKAKDELRHAVEEFDTDEDEDEEKPSAEPTPNDA